MGECGGIPSGEFKKGVAFEVANSGKRLRLESSATEVALLQALLGADFLVTTNLMNNRMIIEGEKEAIEKLIKLFGA